MSIEVAIEQTDPRDRKRYYFEMTPFRTVLTPTVRFLCRSFSKLEVHNAADLPASGPVVLAANHLTNFDVIFMQLAISRPIFFMGKEELFRNPISDSVLRQLGGFPVYRKLHDEWAMCHAQSVLEHGQVLGIFPEGKRSKGHGLYPGKTGAARLALDVACPISPIAIYGTEDLFQQLPRRGVISITFGKPIFPQEGESPIELTDQIMFALADLLPPALRGVYAHRPSGF